MESITAAFVAVLSAMNNDDVRNDRTNNQMITLFSFILFPPCLINFLTIKRSAYTQLYRSFLYIFCSNDRQVLSFFVLNYSISDRKSTLLNSSHVAISYAVFCTKNNKTARLMN